MTTTPAEKLLAVRSATEDEIDLRQLATAH